MRKIEQQMIEAIRQRKFWSTNNTMVHGTDGDVYLHGNHIAKVTDAAVEANRYTFKAWPTRTTVSRLRALGINASVRKGKACIDGQPV